MSSFTSINSNIPQKQPRHFTFSAKTKSNNGEENIYFVVFSSENSYKFNKYLFQKFKCFSS